MNVRKILLLISLLCLTSPLAADLSEELTSEAAWTGKPEEADADTPFFITVDTDFTGNADFKRKSRGHVRFGEASVDTGAVIYYDGCHGDAILALANYEYTLINWNKNPFFKQNHFDTVSVGLGAVSKRLYDWLWQAQVLANFDVDHFKWDSYITWDLIAWGRYDYRDDVGLHFGVLAFTGMKFDRVYPVFGVDWQINDCWRLNLIYPINVSLSYIFNPQWSVSLAAKFIQTRHRVGPHENLPRAIVVYQAGGAELGVNFTSSCRRFTANLHAGEILGGTLKITNMHYHHKRHFRFRSAPYIGGEASYHF